MISVSNSRSMMDAKAANNSPVPSIPGSRTSVGVDRFMCSVIACESLASTSVMTSDIAGLMEGPQRKTAL